MIPAPRGSGVVFVTGAGGFLGGHVADGFMRAGWRVAGFDVRGGEGWRSGAVDAEALSIVAGEQGAPEIIVHCAGSGSVGAAATDPAGDFDAGLGSLRQTLEFMRRQAPRARLVFPSSAAVYGEGQDAPMAEGAPIRPISAYGLHKALAEQLIAGWAELYGLDAVSVRLFSLYGPGLRKQLLWDIARRIGEGAEALELSGDGEEARDFLHVDDAVALIGALASGAVPPVVNGGSGAATTVREAAARLTAALGFSGALRFNGLTRPGDPRRQVADIAAARSAGFEPAVAFEDGVAGFAHWAGEEIRRRI